MNPFDVLKGYITRGMTPKGLVQKIVGKNNPMFNNLIQMAEKGDNQGVETFARNVLKERGIDYDKQVENLRKTLNI